MQLRLPRQKVEKQNNQSNQSPIKDKPTERSCIFPVKKSGNRKKFWEMDCKWKGNALWIFLSNLDTGRQFLQKMHQTMLELDEKAAIINSKTTTIANKHGAGIQAKESLLIFLEATPKHLVYL